MARVDLNLLFVLNVLLEEGSVARAAARMRLSPSAMSRALERLRQVTGDPLLVRAGRGLVPTPRARELAERVGGVVQEAGALLAPAGNFTPADLDRTFAIRCSDGFVESFGAALVAHVGRDAPLARLRFVQRTGRDSDLLRDGTVDLEIGLVSRATGPEVRSQALFHDRFVGVVRTGHPLAKTRVTMKRYLDAGHVLVSRGQGRGPVDSALDAAGVSRNVMATVESFAAAIALARDSDLVATVPDRHTGGMRTGTRAFALPFAIPEIAVSLLWHPRMDADLAHRWLRASVRDVCGPRTQH